MYKLLLTSFLLASASVYAQPVKVFKNPTYPGSEIPFSHYEQGSDEDGVCRVLGYKKAIPGSSKSGNTKDSTVRIDRNARIVSAPVSYKMTKIICTGDTISRSNNETPYLLKSEKIKHPGSGLSFSHYEQASDENGVCKVLGFEKAASGSSKSGNIKTSTLRVNSNGEVIGGVQSYEMNKIICLNKIRTAWSEKSYLISGRDLKHPETGMPFSHYEQASDDNGVCKILGYKKAAIGSSKSGNSKTDTLRVNKHGELTGAPYSYAMTQIVCLNKGTFITGNPTDFYRQQEVSPRDQYTAILGFNFKQTSIRVSTSLIDITKSLEPYVNNSDERKLDQIKVKSTRLAAKIKAKRPVEEVKETLEDLQFLLDEHSNFLEEDLLETDNLDHHGQHLLTSKELITTMIEFLDRDFTGNRADLY